MVWNRVRKLRRPERPAGRTWRWDGDVMTRMGTAIAAVVLVASLAACTHPATGTSPGASGATGAPPSTVVLPTTPAGRQMQWVVQALTAGSGPTEAQIEQHMAQTFLAQAPVSQVTAAFTQARSGGPLTLTTYINTAPTTGQASLTRADGQRLLITLATDSAGLISSLLVRPAPPLPSVQTAADLYRAGQGIGAWTSVLVATVDADGTCRPSQQYGAEDPRPTGSMFKLYVLGAVVEAVQARKLSWDQQLTITREVRSLPSGQLQNAAVGTKVTVRQAAQLMIQISDNTAADLLIGAVGQPALAAAVLAMGNTRPLLLNPFITTKQMFTLQYDAPTLRGQWAAALPGLVDPATGTVTEPAASTVDTRAALLGQLPTTTPTVTSGTTRPGWLDGVEWYATPRDICQAQAALHRWSQIPAGQPVAAILSANAGVDVGPGWTYVGYKGGSDTGVLTGSWYLQPPHGQATILVADFSTAEATKIPDDAWFAAATSGAITHLPK